MEIPILNDLLAAVVMFYLSAFLYIGWEVATFTRSLVHTTKQYK
jgi:hypothetical protein